MLNFHWNKSPHELNHKRASSSSSFSSSSFSSSSPSISVMVLSLSLSLSPFIIMAAVCQHGLRDGKELHIQVNSQPERFLDYSLFIPVIPPRCGVESQEDVCLSERSQS